MKRLTIVGGGWAGLAAAVRATQLGWQVSLLEAAPVLGGRARRIHHQGLTLDNGPHLLIGAYNQTLALMRQLGLQRQQRLPIKKARLWSLNWVYHRVKKKLLLRV